MSVPGLMYSECPVSRSCAINLVVRYRSLAFSWSLSPDGGSSWTFLVPVYLLSMALSSPVPQGPISWAMSELKDCPLQFHDFKSVDHLKVCPRYTAVLARSEDDGIGIEELDTLQLELETLLSSASRRLRVLEAETQVILYREVITRGGLCDKFRARSLS